MFFKVDGDNFAVEAGSGLIGTPTIVSSNGSHGNLGDTDVDAGDDVPVPEAVGRWSTKLKPIPVNDAGLRSLLGADDVPAITGVVVSVMEEDGWSDDLADTGYSAFVDAVHLAVVKVAASVQHALAAPTPQEIKDQIEVVKESAASSVRAAVKNAMSGWQLIWYGAFGNNDDSVGTEAFTTTPAEIDRRRRMRRRPAVSTRCGLCGTRASANLRSWEPGGRSSPLRARPWRSLPGSRRRSRTR